jgi:tRNA-dihydrouridine synthase 1
VQAWRLLTRSFLEPEASKTMLAYSPMLHSRLFRENAKFRDAHFQPTRESLTSHNASSSTPWLDGNPKNDRPLFVQFCSNNPEDLLDAAQYVAPYCDAVDLNLGCPQGIARSGHYGAFLQEDWSLIYKLINKLHRELSVPVTAKFRILESKERTLDYAKMILSAGASIITVHGRRREQKGHNMGIADWSYIRHLRDNLPPETVIFANGNILSRGDLQPCLDATGADGVMSAEGNLSDPTIFAIPPPSGVAVREYWRGPQGQEGYRIDAVIRRYLDIIHQHVLEKDPPTRRPLFLPSDPMDSASQDPPHEQNYDDGQPPQKKQKKDRLGKIASPNLKAMQGHLFQLLRPILTTHTDIRDALAKCRVGDIAGFEHVLAMVENAVSQALTEYAHTRVDDGSNPQPERHASADERPTVQVASQKALQHKKPWWVCQPYIRPLPEQAVESGALTASKKEIAKMKKDRGEQGIRRDDGTGNDQGTSTNLPHGQLPKEAVVCG